jgi:hypothetical protein
VRPRRAWFVFATTAVTGTIAAAVLPSPWSVVCGVLAALGATGAFVMFVVIVVLEDGEDLDRGGHEERGDRGGHEERDGRKGREGRANSSRRDGEGPPGPLRPRGRGDP